MILNENTTLLLIVIICLLSFGIGYIIGLINSHKGVLSIGTRSDKSSIVTNKQVVSIDDTKFVTDIRTDNLEKKYDSLGDKSSSQENISGSINKLKNMKG